MLVTGFRRESSASRLEALASKRVLLKEGPLGTGLLGLGLSESDFRGERFAAWSRPLSGNCDVLVLTQPALVERIHAEYLEAGADLIETNTFNAQALSQRKFGLEREVYALNFAAARLARKVADRFSERDPERPRFVLGNLGPSDVCLSRAAVGAEPKPDFEQVRAAYAEQAHALIEGGVDALLLETVFDEQTAKACLAGIATTEIELGAALPILLSVTVGADGRMPSGRAVSEFLREIQGTRLFSVGINCAFGAESVRAPLEALAAHAPSLVSVYPNAGLPDATGRYSEPLEQGVALVASFAAASLANIIGGCCGTTPATLRALGAAVRGLAPRPFARRA